MTTTLKVNKREGKALPGEVPAVVYGPKQESVSLSVSQSDLEKVLAEAGESSIVNLTGLGDDIEVLIHDVAFRPIKGGVEHVDFYAIERGKELTTNVPLEFVGEAPALKAGGVLTKALQEVEVTCRPSALPRNIEVDVSVLETFEDSIRVKDLALPEGVKVENESEDTVAVVVPVEEEPEEPVAVDMDAVEVEQKGKDEGGEESAGEAEAETKAE